MSSPADAAAVVERDPRCASEGVADTILHSHVSAERRPVVDVGRFAERAVSAAHIVMVTTQHHCVLKNRSSAMYSSLFSHQLDFVPENICLSYELGRSVQPGTKVVWLVAEPGKHNVVCCV